MGVGSSRSGYRSCYRDAGQCVDIVGYRDMRQGVGKSWDVRKRVDIYGSVAVEIENVEIVAVCECNRAEVELYDNVNKP